MTSTAPARKPYRKAPPQHRETRQSLPVFQDDLSGSHTATGNPPVPAQPDPSQVIYLQNHSPVLQRTHFTGPYPKCLDSPEAPDVLSSSWSDSELDVSSLSSLELTVLPPPRIFSHGALKMDLPRKQQKGMNRFISRSEDLLTLSGEEDPPTSEGSQQGIRGSSPSHSSRSGERSLVFKEQAEILAPKLGNHAPKSAFPTPALPPKGILKQPHQLGVHCSDSLRKSKSAEMLGQSHSSGRSRKPKSMSLDREREPGTSPLGRAASTSSTSPSTVPPEWKIQLLEEKLKFSQFLDEITYRVLSPASLKLLGGKKVESSRGTQSQQQVPSQQTSPKLPPEKKPERSRPWDLWAAQHGRATRNERDSRPKMCHAAMRKDSLEQEPNREGARPKAEGPVYARVGGGYDSRRSSETEWDTRNRRGAQHQPPSQKPTRPEIRAQPKNTVDKLGPPKVGVSTVHVESESMAASPTTFSVLSQIKESLSDADKIKILQQQNEDLRRRLNQTTHKMEAMETEFETSRHYMQAEMGRTRDDLEKMRDKFRRLQNSYTASQRANQDLEEKLHALLRKVERDKKTMDQEIVELTNKLVDAKNTIDKLEELNERYRQDCNLAVQLLKCNKSHFRNHKFADVLVYCVSASRTLEPCCPRTLEPCCPRTQEPRSPERRSRVPPNAGAAFPRTPEPRSPERRSRVPPNAGAALPPNARAVKYPNAGAVEYPNAGAVEYPNVGALPYELQEMVNKHMKSSLPDKSQSPQGAQSQDPDTLSLTPADVVPTSVIARVLEKPEPLVLNSAQSSSSAGRPVAEDVFVHVDMTGPQNENGGPGHARQSGNAASDQQHINGMCRSQVSPDGPSAEEVPPSFEKLNPYPAPPPPHPLYPGRKVIEFSSDDKVKIPKNSPLPNCTYATRQAISLSLVQNEEEAGERQRTVPNSPAVSDGGWRSGTSSSSGGGHTSLPRTPQQTDITDPLSSQSSPFSSPPQPPSAFASSGSSEEDLLANWQRMFVEKMAPSSEGTLVNRTSFSSETVKELQRSRNSKSGRESSDRGILRGAYSDGEEGSSAQSWTASRESSLDTDTSSVADLRTKRGQYGADFSQEESEHLLMAVDHEDGASGDTMVTVEGSPASAKRQEFAEDAGSAGSSTEERDVLPQDFPVIGSRVLAGLEDYTDKPPSQRHHPQSSSSRPHKSPKRMGVHHLHRKDSLTRAQEHGNLLD
ncbi:hypothetical protein NFI96_016060 [Prochilodus magdalenae]|nr:hypothetical protein NFI96_016060 [Prochilodus magdalenae]